MSSTDIFEINESEDNSVIIYVTIAIIICLILLWLFIVFLTGEDPINILNEMTKLTAQISPVND